MRSYGEIFDDLIKSGDYDLNSNDSQRAFNKVEKENRKRFAESHLVAIMSVERKYGTLIIQVSSVADALVTLVVPKLKEDIFLTQLKELLAEDEEEK